MYNKGIRGIMFWVEILEEKWLELSLDQMTSQRYTGFLGQFFALFYEQNIRLCSKVIFPQENSLLRRAQTKSTA